MASHDRVQHDQERKTSDRDSERVVPEPTLEREVLFRSPALWGNTDTLPYEGIAHDKTFVPMWDPPKQK